jgi:hypothetical protein
MESKILNGYLLLADLSGYTKFMASTELEHAKEILLELISVVTKNLKSIFTISEIEGDAVFAYASENKISRGETLIELIESTYYNFVFQKQVMLDRTTCTCRACKEIASLDLKFINHFGSYALQDYYGVQKPLGSEVNLIHRLLKNSAKETTGIQSYSLFTKQVFNRLGMPQDIFKLHSEFYEHFGETDVFVMDLQESQLKLQKSKSIIIQEEDADFVAKYLFEMEAPVLWDWLNDTTKRNLWMTGVVWKGGKRMNGRTAAGATNHCAHGKNESLEIILDWRPFKYFTYETGTDILKIVSTVMLIEKENGTELNEIIKIKNKLPRFFTRFIAKFVALKVMHVYECYKRIAELQKSSLNILSNPGTKV